MYPGLCDHGVPRVRSPVMQATRFQIVHAWVVAPLDVDLRIFLETLIRQLTAYMAEEPVVMYPEVCIHEVLLDMSPVMQPTGSRIVCSPGLWLHLLFLFTQFGDVCFFSGFEDLQARCTERSEDLFFNVWGHDRGC